MEILDLMKERHSVRNYLDKKIETDKRDILNAFIEKLNNEFGTHAQVFYDDANAFKNAEASYGRFNGCKNYVVLVGKNAEMCGYVGGLVALKLQEMGLNSCFVGLTYKKGNVKSKVKFDQGEKIQCNLAIGYGINNGHSHKVKTYDQVVIVKGEKPANFDEVVAACLLAPTAINQQKFKVVCENENIEVKKAGFGFYMDFDLGIVKAHKDLILGKISL